MRKRGRGEFDPNLNGGWKRSKPGFFFLMNFRELSSSVFVSWILLSCV